MLLKYARGRCSGSAGSCRSSVVSWHSFTRLPLLIRYRCVARESWLLVAVIATGIVIVVALATVIVNASARPPRLAGLPTVGTCNYRYTGI